VRRGCGTGVRLALSAGWSKCGASTQHACLSLGTSKNPQQLAIQQQVLPSLRASRPQAGAAVAFRPYAALRADFSRCASTVSQARIDSAVRLHHTDTSEPTRYRPCHWPDKGCYPSKGCESPPPAGTPYCIWSGRGTVPRKRWPRLTALSAVGYLEAACRTYLVTAGTTGRALRGRPCATDHAGDGVAVSRALARLVVAHRTRFLVPAVSRDCPLLSARPGRKSRTDLVIDFFSCIAHTDGGVHAT